MAPDKTDVDITKTVICPLETSNRKNERVQRAIDDWQAAAGRMADLMPSFDTHHWTTQDTTLYRVVKREFPDSSLRTHDLGQAAYKVGESFGSWKSNNHRKRQPSFGDGNYARFCHCGVAVEENDTGWGIKIGLEPYKPEWFTIKARPYVADHLEAVTDGDASTGSAELHLSDDGDLSCHLTVKRSVPVYEPDGVDTVVGIDIGERCLYALAVCDGESTKRVEIESGREFRHYRDRLTNKRASLMESGDRRGVMKCRDEHRRYTDHVTHVASRQAIDVASEHAPCAIALEDLSGYRETATDAIHDWPFHELQTKIAYKATEAGIPVGMVDPAGTSVTCSVCGDRGDRDGTSFTCDCGYTVHADVNAAKNIAAGL